MAGSLNKVMLIGNVGRDPEMRYTPSGEPVTNFSVATSWRRPSPDGQYRDETEWHYIVAWRKLAEQCNEYLTKGRKVYIEGRLQTRSWDGPDGQKRYRTEIIASTMVMLDSRDQQRSRDGSMGMGDEREAAPHDENAIDLEDTPF